MFDKKLLQEIFKKFAITIIKFAEELPDKSGFKTEKNQIIRSGPSLAANYRVACRGKSPDGFRSNLDMVEEETDETMYLFEFIDDLSAENQVNPKSLWEESSELRAITVSAIKTSGMNHPESLFMKFPNS